MTIPPTAYVTKADYDNLELALVFARFYLGGRAGDTIANNEPALRFNTEQALKIINAALNGTPIDPAIIVNIRMKQ